MSTICLTKNPIQHSMTKHIEIRHHFIRDHVQSGDILVKFVCTDDNLADLFTKPLNADRFWKLVDQSLFHLIFHMIFDVFN